MRIEVELGLADGRRVSKSAEIEEYPGVLMPIELERFKVFVARPTDDAQALRIVATERGEKVFDEKRPAAAGAAIEIYLRVQGLRISVRLV